VGHRAALARTGPHVQVVLLAAAIAAAYKDKPVYVVRRRHRGLRHSARAREAAACDAASHSREPLMVPMPLHFRQTLAELELLSHGAVAALNKTAPASDRDPRPGGEAHPPHIEYARRWLHSGSDLERERIFRDAKATLDQWRGRGRGASGRGDVKLEPLHLLHRDVIRQGDGWDASEVARVFRLPIREVMAIRERAGRDPSTGKPAIRDEDPVAQARRLHEHGHDRRASPLSGVEPSTVSRRLRKRDDERRAA
jgi:hypothetical protein